VLVGISIGREKTVKRENTPWLKGEKKKQAMGQSETVWCKQRSSRATKIEGMTPRSSGNRCPWGESEKIGVFKNLWEKT